MEKISLIIPVYNAEKTLDRCLDSVVSQTYENLEIILVNDGSKDRSGKSCDKWAQKDDRIKVIHKENGGVSSARNIALKNLSGDYILWVDSDDFIELDYCQTLIDVAQKENADVVVARFTRSEELLKENDRYDEYKVYKKGKAYHDFLGIRISPNLWDKLYKKELFEEIYFSGNIGEDAYANSLIFQKDITVVVMKKYIGYHYILNDESITMKNADVWKESINVALKIKEDALRINKKYEKKANYKILYASLILYNGADKKELKEYARESIKRVILKQHFLFCTWQERKNIIKGFKVAFLN